MTPLKNWHVGVVGAVCVCGMSGCVPVDGRVGTGAIAHVAGTWGTTGQLACDQAPQTISLIDRGERLLFRTPRPLRMLDGTMSDSVYYKVLKAEGERIWMFVEGEYRLTDAGDPVVWVLVMVDPNTFKWRRTDWSKESFTRPVKRCNQ